MKSTSKKTIAILFALNTSFAVAGEGIIPTPDYSGSFYERSTLTGDWRGVRQDLANNGLQADFKVVTTYQNMFDGGIDRDDGFVSTQDLRIQLDTGKADLWAGGLIKLRVQSRFGDALEDVGSFSPTNTNALFPNDLDNINGDTIGITELTYTQMLSPQFGILAGLVNNTEGDANELAGIHQPDDVTRTVDLAGLQVGIHHHVWNHGITARHAVFRSRESQDRAICACFGDAIHRVMRIVAGVIVRTSRNDRAI